MNRIIPICFEWNCYNGFTFHLMHVELYKPVNIDASLMGVNASRNFLYIDLFYVSIKIFDKTP